MSDDLKKINAFIKEHHVLTLATSTDDEISACSLFYAYDEAEKIFVVASSEETLHIQHVKKNNRIAGNVLLETSELGKVQGLQFRGVIEENNEKRFSQLYFKTFPYALALTPKLWILKVNFLKLTDNRLGFGKKIIWP